MAETASYNGLYINLDRSRGGNDEGAFGEESADLCRSVWMLQQSPLL